ncbi:MAG TPA: SpoIIE family protein phosphatase [Jatrophihabitans sp.]|uniref:SpoIIE family protein phosphatase n=1 Tax=Jatrophihabitans sp. TaxID=1932789 RepID=UPI002E09B074|nr:SpoIIE family protein phosphatase [Jatrophihabitans sp.]
METLRSGTQWFRIDSATASGSVRRASTRLAAKLGFDEIRVAEAGIVASEAASNVWQHGREGVVAVQVALRPSGPGLQVVAIDNGPGMADIPFSTSDGQSTAGTLGVGLGAIARLSSSLDVSSNPGLGTVLVADIWPRPDEPAAVDIGALTRPIEGEDQCGDVVGARESEGHQVVMLADGLGHGPLAADSALEALTVFHETTSTDPVAVLTAMHGRLSHTRGAAIAVASIDPYFERMAFAGIGNVSTFVHDGDKRHVALSYPGIVGHDTARLRRADLAFGRGSLLIMHSDGVRETWNLQSTPGLLRRSSTVIAASILRDAGNRPDDASILVLRGRR